MRLQHDRSRGMARMLWAWVMCMLLSASMVGAQETAPAPQPLAAQPPAAYRLQPGDEVAVAVMPQKEYDCVGIVAPDGMLYLKNVGAVKAEGLTVTHITQHLTEMLEKELRRPQVTVQLIRFTKLEERVTVTGAVARPGPIPLEPELRLLKAIELAGGVTKDALLTEVRVLHKDLTYSIADLSDAERAADSVQNRILRDGDSIEVPRITAEVTVGGAVARPGAIELAPDLRVRRAVDMAGGVKDGGDLSRVQIIHRDLSMTVVNIEDDHRLTDDTANVRLKDGDSVVVPLRFKQGFAAITGAVEKPGSFELKPGWSIDDLIGAADKLKPVANLEAVQLKRQGKVEVLNLRALRRAENAEAAERLVLEPGDEVHVPEYDRRVMLLAPGQEVTVLPLRENGTRIADFFRETESINALDTNKGDFNGIRLMRRGQKKEMRINLTRALGDPDHAQNIPLEDGDVLVVLPRDPRDKSMDWIRTLGPIGIFSQVLFRFF